MRRQNPTPSHLQMQNRLPKQQKLHSTLGQYLNACVWFETLFGKNCVGNFIKSSEQLNEERMFALQEMAHSAVSDACGEAHEADIPEISQR